MTSEELNEHSCYCVLPVVRPGIVPKPIYVGGNLTSAAIEFQQGTVHGRGKTTGDAHAQAVYNLIRQQR